MLAQGGAIGTQHLQADPLSRPDASTVGPAQRSFLGARPQSQLQAAETPLPLRATSELREELREIERERIVQAMSQAGGNQTLAARLLGISRRALITRLENFKLPRPRKGQGDD